MPLQLQARSDNGNSEAKNQTVFKYCSWLVCRSAFVNITLGQLRPGHAHFRADQKFRVASGEISKCRDTLEEKAGFIDALKNMPNTVVESLDGTNDWKDSFQNGMYHTMVTRRTSTNPDKDNERFMSSSSCSVNMSQST